MASKHQKQGKTDTKAGRKGTERREEAVTKTDPYLNQMSQRGALDNTVSEEVSSPQTTEPQAPETTTERSGEGYMKLTFKGLSPNGKNAIYVGARMNVRVPLGIFEKNTPVDAFEVKDGDAGPVFLGARQPKAKLTPEERKALRASQPKLTLAERIAKREAAIARDKERLAKQQAKEAAKQPELASV